MSFAWEYVDKTADVLGSVVQMPRSNVACNTNIIAFSARYNCSHSVQSRYTMSGKKRPPPKKKRQNNFMNIEQYFFVSWKTSYLQCFCEISRQLAYLLLIYCFYKKMVKNCRLQHYQSTAWCQPLDGATDRVVWLGSHHLCGSESVAYSSASLRAWWSRAVWTSVVTAIVTDIYRLNL